MQQHQASVEVTDVLLHRKLQGHFKDTVVFTCPELEHKLLLSIAACLGFVLLHGYSWGKKQNKIAENHE